MTMTPEHARELIGHTPGPWYLDEPTLVVAYDPEDMEKPWSVARVIGLCGSPVQTTENARLIAAAPDLLAGYLALAEENERLRSLLTEAKDDLTTYVDQDYPPDTCAQYPDIARRHFRDMALCRRIGAALASPPVDTSGG